jgi:hypothetical protein
MGIGMGILVLARLMTLEIHDAWPWWPTSCLPRPRRLPRSDPVLADMASCSLGSGEMAE